MIVRRFWESLTDESISDGDFDNQGTYFKETDITISMVGISGDDALNLLHRASHIIDVDGINHTERKENLTTILEDLVFEVDGIDSIEEGTTLEMVVYGLAQGTADGEPYARAFSVMVGADLYDTARGILKGMMTR